MEKIAVQLDKNSQVRRARRTKFLFVAILFFLLLLAGVIGFLRKANYQVATIRVDQARSINPLVVERTTKEFLSGNYFFVIPKSNALLVSKSSLRKYLLDEIPSLKNVRVHFSDPTTLLVTVEEREPNYVWCQETDCYFVDEQGMIYESSPVFSEGVFVTFSGGDVIKGSPLRKRFISPEMFTVTLRMLELLKKFPMTVIGVNYGVDNAIRISNIGGTSVGPHTVIMTSNTSDAETLSDSLRLIVNDKSFASMLASKGTSLEYVDLRFPGKIYYKFSN